MECSEAQFVDPFIAFEIENREERVRIFDEHFDTLVRQCILGEV